MPEVNFNDAVSLMLALTDAETPEEIIHAAKALDAAKGEHWSLLFLHEFMKEHATDDDGPTVVYPRARNRPHD